MVNMTLLKFQFTTLASCEKDNEGGEEEEEVKAPGWIW